MRVKKELFIILYIFILLLNEPHIVRMHVFEKRGDGRGTKLRSETVIDPFTGLDDAEQIHLIYALNGGINDDDNPDVVAREGLPFQLQLPVREGYNFAGWYTDIRYTNKITEINSENAGNMILFAKWTPEIDNHYNVEMYSYRSADGIRYRNKKLNECNYGFLDDVIIPGMPSTRERDYLENVISSEAQCMQGLCFTTEYILMTSYAEGEENPGSLMVFDKETGDYLATLRMKSDSHLGGIAFDGENVWICHSNSRTLERIPYDYIKKIAEDAPRYCVDASALSNEYRLKNTPSCITWYGGRIWVATHTKLFDSKLVSYSYDAGDDKLYAVKSYNIPSKVQGIAFDASGAVYLSTSYGRNNSSYLKVYSSLLALTGNPNGPSRKVEMPPCSEEIAITDDNIYILFESASRKYFEGTDGNGMSTSPIDKVLEVTVASVW